MLALLKEYASSLSALAAATGLLFAGIQSRKQAKAQDLQALLNAFGLHTQAEETLGNAATPATQQAALAQYYNVMEVSAAAINHKLYRQATRKMETGRLIDDCALVALWLDKNTESGMRFSAGTFAELDRFRKKYRKRIDKQVERLKKKDARA